MFEQNGIEMTKRIQYIDIAKGLGIISIVVGHSVHGFLCGVIYSFHMVLFFLLSSLTTKYSRTEKEFFHATRKSFHHLIIPMLLVYGIKVIIGSFLLPADISFNQYIYEKCLSLLYSSGNDVHLDGVIIANIGLLWFLLVLFSARTIFDWLQLKFRDHHILLGGLCYILSYLGVKIGKKQFLPFSFDITLVVLIIFYVTYIAKGFFRPEIDTLKKCLYCTFIYVFCVVLPYLLHSIHGGAHLNIAGRTYPLFPVCFIGAISVTEVIICVCYIFTKITIIGGGGGDT